MNRNELASAYNAALEAAREVNAYIARKKEPPGISLGKVKAFQQVDGRLNQDGLWGPNARAAAIFYLTRTDLPPVNKKFAKNKVTWTKPPIQVTEAQFKAISKMDNIIASTVPNKPKGKKAKAAKTASIVKAKRAIASDTPRFGQDFGFNEGRVDAEQMIADGVTRKIEPRLSKIEKLLAKQAASAQATREHLKKNKLEKTVKTINQKLDRLIRSSPSIASQNSRILGLVI